mgnify:CR=1 FL=1
MQIPTHNPSTKVNSTVYPTLSKGNLHISTATNAVVTVIDSTGRTLDNYQSSGELTINLNYPNGFYLVRVRADDTKTHKVVLNN